MPASTSTSSNSSPTIAPIDTNAAPAISASSGSSDATRAAASVISPSISCAGSKSSPEHAGQPHAYPVPTWSNRTGRPLGHGSQGSPTQSAHPHQQPPHAPLKQLTAQGRSTAEAPDLDNVRSWPHWRHVVERCPVGVHPVDFRSPVHGCPYPLHAETSSIGRHDRRLLLRRWDIAGSVVHADVTCDHEGHHLTETDLAEVSRGSMRGESLVVGVPFDAHVALGLIYRAEYLIGQAARFGSTRLREFLQDTSEFVSILETGGGVGDDKHMRIHPCTLTARFPLRSASTRQHIITGRWQRRIS